MNIFTIVSLATYDISLLEKALKRIYKYSNGIDYSEVVDSSNLEIKWLEIQLFLKKDINLYLSKRLLTVTEKLRQDKRLCSTVTVSLKTKVFIEYGHQKIQRIVLIGYITRLNILFMKFRTGEYIR